MQYLFRYRDKPGARWFMAALAAQAVFCLAYAAGLLVPADPLLREGLEIVAIVGLNWIGVLFLGFTLEYTGRGEVIHSWSYRVLYAFPLTVTLLLPFNGRHGLFWSDFSVESAFGAAAATYTFEPLFYITLLGGTSVSAIGVLLLFETVWSYGPLYRSEALAVALSPFPAAAGLFAWLLGVGPAEEINAVALLFLPHIALDAYAFVGKGMFEFHPATSRAAERSVLKDLATPAFVLDEAGRVVNANPAARELFDLGDDVVTEHVSAAVGTGIDLAADDARHTIQSDGRRREFRVEPSPLTDSGGNHVGYTLLFQEITEEIQREERLSVLNRVLRHNLRNELTIVQGHLGIAEKRTGDERTEQSLSLATDAVDSLIETSETARSIERTFGDGSTDRRRVDLEEILAVAGEIEQTHPDAAVSVDGERGVVETNPALLRSILEQLLENAVVHGGAEGSVALTAETRGTTLSLVVADSGPGIPEHELAVLEQGEETALEHGSGLGLWLVKWGTERLGGTAEFEVTAEGTRVEITLPDAVVDSDPRGADARRERAAGPSQEAAGATKSQTEPSA